MRVIVLGGTWFVGRAVTRALVSAGHQVLVVHRGEREPADLADAEHLHMNRSSWPRHRADFAAFAPDAAVDVSAGDSSAAAAALAALPPDVRLVAISSGDVYRAYESMRRGHQTDPVPLTEESALRTARFLDGPDWENLEIEQAYLAAGATILRLGAAYGEHDYQHRFEPVLRRIRAGRERMPTGAGSFLFSRVYVGDVGRAVVAALGTGRARGECLNIAETPTAPMRLFYEQVIAATGVPLELVQVPDQDLPADLGALGDVPQHLLLSSEKAWEVLGWRAHPDDEVLERSVRWHLANPPESADPDLGADDRALEVAS